MSDVAVAGRRARGGGGSARRAERTAVSFDVAGYIQRNIPNFEILNEEALQIIEWNAETVLEEIGVNFVDLQQLKLGVSVHSAHTQPAFQALQSPSSAIFIAAEGMLPSPVVKNMSGLGQEDFVMGREISARY